jgi:hypothetical protein
VLAITKCGILDLLNRSGSSFATRLIVRLILGLGAEEVKAKKHFTSFVEFEPTWRNPGRLFLLFEVLETKQKAGLATGSCPYYSWRCSKKFIVQSNTLPNTPCTDFFGEKSLL